LALGARRKIEQVLNVFKLAMDRTIDHLFNDPDNETLEHLDSLLFSLEVSAYALAVACAFGSEPKEAQPSTAPGAP